MLKSCSHNITFSDWLEKYLHQIAWCTSHLMYRQLYKIVQDAAQLLPSVTNVSTGTYLTYIASCTVSHSWHIAAFALCWKIVLWHASIFISHIQWELQFSALSCINTKTQYLAYFAYCAYFYGYSHLVPRSCRLSAESCPYIHEDCEFKAANKSKKNWYPAAWMPCMDADPERKAPLLDADPERKAQHELPGLGNPVLALRQKWPTSGPSWHSQSTCSRRPPPAGTQVLSADPWTWRYKRPYSTRNVPPFEVLDASITAALCLSVSVHQLAQHLRIPPHNRSEHSVRQELCRLLLDECRRQKEIVGRDRWCGCCSRPVPRVISARVSASNILVHWRVGGLPILVRVGLRPPPEWYGWDYAPPSRACANQFIL